MLNAIRPAVGFHAGAIANPVKIECLSVPSAFITIRFASIPRSVAGESRRPAPVPPSRVHTICWPFFDQFGL